jgi:hypothetical protein
LSWHQQVGHHPVERRRQLDQRLRRLDFDDDLIDRHPVPGFTFQVTMSAPVALAYVRELELLHVT